MVITLVAGFMLSLASMAWAGDRTAPHYGPPGNGQHYGSYKQGPPHHPYRQPYRPYHHWRPYPYPRHGYVYHQYYVPYYAPLYGSQFSATIVQPNWAFSWSVGLP